MKKTIKVPTDNGEYNFKLEELLEKKHISKNKLMRDIDTDFKVIQRLAKGTVTRVDIFVLARIFEYLDCDWSDIIEYKSNKKKKSN